MLRGHVADMRDKREASLPQPTFEKVELDPRLEGSAFDFSPFDTGICRTMDASGWRRGGLRLHLFWWCFNDCHAGAVRSMAGNPPRRSRFPHRLPRLGRYVPWGALFFVQGSSPAQAWRPRFICGYLPRWGAFCPQFIFLSCSMSWSEFFSPRLESQGLVALA